MDKKDMDTPLSETSVSLKLELIQRRCSELLDEPDSLELTLEEPTAEDSQANDLFDLYRS
jgi:hypothetical protein